MTGVKCRATSVAISFFFKKVAGKGNVVVKGPVGEFSKSEKIGKGKY